MLCFNFDRIDGLVTEQEVGENSASPSREQVQRVKYHVMLAHVRLGVLVLDILAGQADFPAGNRV